MVLDLCRSAYFYLGTTTIHKIFETNSRFHVKLRGSLISVFQEFFASIDKIVILAGRLGTRLSSYEV